MYFAVKFVVGQGPSIAAGVLFLFTRWGVVLLLSIGCYLLLSLLPGATAHIAWIVGFFSWFLFSALLGQAMWSQSYWGGMKVTFMELGLGICMTGALGLLTLFLGLVVTIVLAAVALLAFWVLEYQ